MSITTYAVKTKMKLTPHQHQYFKAGHAHGKSVWFRLGSEGAPARPGPPEQPEAAAGVSECVRVALVDVPLFLHAAWQRKAAALLREDLLITFEDEDEESFEEVVRHAECSSAMGLLSDAIPEPEAS